MAKGALPTKIHCIRETNDDDALRLYMKIKIKCMWITKKSMGLNEIYRCMLLLFFVCFNENRFWNNHHMNEIIRLEVTTRYGHRIQNNTHTNMNIFEKEREKMNTLTHTHHLWNKCPMFQWMILSNLRCGFNTYKWNRGACPNQSVSYKRPIELAVVSACVRVYRTGIS